MSYDNLNYEKMNYIFINNDSIYLNLRMEYTHISGFPVLCDTPNTTSECSFNFKSEEAEFLIENRIDYFSTVKANDEIILPPHSRIGIKHLKQIQINLPNKHIVTLKFINIA